MSTDVPIETDSNARANGTLKKALQYSREKRTRLEKCADLATEFAHENGWMGEYVVRENTVWWIGRSGSGKAAMVVDGGLIMLADSKINHEPLDVARRLKLEAG